MQDALEKSRHLWAAIERFAGGQSHVLNLFRTKLKATVSPCLRQSSVSLVGQVFVSDGLRAEPASARHMKDNGM